MERRIIEPISPTAHPWISVLASGSSGNCSVIVWHDDHKAHAALIDLGLSPRRTTRLLASLGLSIDAVSFALLTHLDSDHIHPGWSGPRSPRFPVHLHESHAARASGPARGLDLHAFSDRLTLPGLHADAMLVSHDELGASSFRLRFASGEHLGFATDVGRVTAELIDHLLGVDVLAIESNYCPILEHASSRPDFLKRRIMGGSGHLSNEESARAARAIGPREHLILLHLSRECNRPSIALERHAAIDCPVTVSTHAEPTLPIHIRRSPRPSHNPQPVVRVGRQSMLFAHGVRA